MAAATWTASTWVASRWAATRCFLCWPRRSHRHDLLFLAGEQLFDFGDGAVGHLLYFSGLARVVVLADLMILLELFEQIEAIATNVTNRHTGPFGIFVRDFHDLTPPFFIEFGNAQLENLPFCRR